MNRGKLLLSMVVVAMLVGLVGCSDRPEPPAPIVSNEQSYGSGVYVVDFGNNTPNTVAAFLTRHPDLRITAMYAADQDGQGYTKSLMLVTEKK